MKTNMILLFLSALMILGCSEEKDREMKRKFFLNLSNGSGWYARTSTVRCDSFQMIGTKKADVWVDGTKIRIEAQNVIYPGNGY